MPFLEAGKVLEYFLWCVPGKEIHKMHLLDVFQGEARTLQQGRISIENLARGVRQVDVVRTQGENHPVAFQQPLRAGMLKGNSQRACHLPRNPWLLLAKNFWTVCC